MTLPSHMSAVQLTAHGGPEVLVWRDDLPLPRPGPAEVLVQVLAAGVNNTDINTRLGWYSSAVTGATEEGIVAKDGGWAGALDFPRIQGADLCGRVVALGEGVIGPAIGTRVTCAAVQPAPSLHNPNGFVTLGSEYDGAFAQYCVLPVDQLYDVSASPLSDIEIAAIPCAFGTAEALITRAGILPGQSVLVTGASGGVGLAAVALAHLRGARVTGITNPAKAEAVRAAGASDILDRDATPPAGSFDAVIDIVGGSGWAARLDALRPGGICAVAGAIAGPMVTTDLRRLYLNDLTIRGSTYQPPEIFARLVSLINAGAIRPLVSNTYPLRAIARAQEDFMSKHYPGKLVLLPQESAP
ncbi:MAG: zinc-binding dehydrogenase [Paracoccaceae bacterium]